MSPAENLVGNFIALSDIANNNLFTLCDHDSVDGSRIMSCSRSTPTESFNLQCIHAICKFDQSGRTWKEFGLKVSQNSEGVDINAQTIDNLSQLINLNWLIELRFIADDVIDTLTDREVFNNKFMNVERFFDFYRI
jgi:hypothetical protein